MTTYLRYTPIVVDNRLRKVILRYTETAFQIPDTNARITRSRSAAYAVADLAAALEELKLIIFRVAREHGFPRTERELRGTLVIFTPDYVSSRSLVNIDIAELEFEQVMEVISFMTQSNRLLEWKDLEFVFHFNRYELILGAGKISKPKWWKVRDMMTWITYEDDIGALNCAAVALAYALNPTKNRDTLRTKSRQLQSQLGWGDLVSVAQIKDFVDLYPQYRVTILFTASYVDSSQTTFTGADFDTNIPDGAVQPPNTIYIFYHSNGSIGHYVWINSVQAVVRNLKSNNRLFFCHNCVQVYGRVQHDCVLKEFKRPDTKCRLGCGIFHGKEKCPRMKCRNCENQFKRNGPGEYELHTCLIKSDMKDPLEFQQNGCQDGKKIALLVWDIESAFKRVTFGKVNNFKKMTIETFEESENGCYTGQVLTQCAEVDQHVPNLICIQDVFGTLQKTFGGPDCMLNFLSWISSYNHGNCTLVAHNSGRYDSRLLFDQVLRLRVPRQTQQGRVISTPGLIMRGNNILSLKIDNLKFIDSINHLPGSLRNLGRDYSADSECVKGYFPYTFNTEANWDYVGQIPGLEYFDVNLNEREEFMEWYNQASRYPWSLQRELELYCKQDVKVLANIVKSYHLICCKENYNLSPWQYLTAPSYVHACYLRNITASMELPDPNQDPVLYNSVCEEKAADFWAVIPANVHNFTKQSLRGGRTDVRTFHAELTSQEIADGIRFAYVDVVSLYPYQQAVHKFPVGVPEIFIYNDEYKPCKNHQGVLKCGCQEKWLPHDIRISQGMEPRARDILNDPNFFGIICATVEPPKDLFHPILPVYDHHTLKCTFPLTTITEGIFTSIEFKKALEYGYQLIKVHRYDKYKAADSLWADKIKDQYMQKMINSRNKPSPEEHRRLVREYDVKFDMGEELKKAFNQNLWGKRPAIKQAYKTMVNCAWGKHAERIDKDQVHIAGMEGCESMEDILQNHSSGLSSIRITSLDDRHDMIKVKNDYKQVQPNLYGAYLPCAVFVPAYGRLQLWEELNKLGKRVLYHDTDSIIYKKSITGEYNIPESDIWGEWEREDVDIKNGGIIEFVAAGPKSYSFKCFNGHQVLKTKGVSLGPKTMEIFNFDIMKELVLQGIEMNQAQIVQIPQRQFLYKVGQGIFTVNMLKKIGFNPEHVKGFIGPDKRHYPQGYTGNIG